MDESRLTKKVFTWDFSLCKNNWSEKVKLILTKLGMENVFYGRQICDLNEISSKLRNCQKISWLENVNKKPKLRSYITFKSEFGEENYLKINLTRTERSMLAQFRCGILPIRIETGRFRNEALPDRRCIFCDLDEIEDESHFLLRCSLYTDERNTYLSELNTNTIPNTNIIQYLMTHKPRQCAKYIRQAFLKRREILYV